MKIISINSEGDAMNKWDNGELVTKPRIQDESWYADYQSLVEMIVYGNFKSEEEFLKAYEEDYKSVYRRDPTPQQHEQFARWAKYHWEIQKELEANENGDQYGTETV